RAFHNVCRHRGCRLCEEPTGQLANAIRCPYHTWTYGLDGSLRGAPNMEGAAGLDPTAYPLHSVGAALWEGFVFICLAGSLQPFESSHAPILSRFERYNMPNLRAVRRVDYDVHANW